MEQVSLRVDGVIYSGWQSVQLTHSIQQLPAYLTLQAAPMRHALKLSHQYQLYYGDELISIGRIDEITESVDYDRHILTVQVRSENALMADCAITIAGAKNESIEQCVARACKPFGMRHNVKSQGTIKDFALASEKPADKLREITEPHNAWVFGDKMAGVTVMAKTDSLGTHAPLTRAKQYTITASHADRYSHYKVVSSAPLSTTTEASATDSAVYNKRCTELVTTRPMDQSECSTFANAHKNDAIASSLTIRATVVGWRDSAHDIWLVGKKVPVQLGTIDQDMLLTAVSCSCSNQDGTTSELTLQLPQQKPVRKKPKKDTEYDLAEETQFSEVGL